MWNRIHALAANTNATDTIHAIVIGRKSSLMIVPTVFSMHSTRNNRLRTVIKHRQLAYMTANAVSNGRVIRIRICPARISLLPCKSPALSSLKLNCFRLLPVRLPNAVDRQHQELREEEGPEFLWELRTVAVRRCCTCVGVASARVLISGSLLGPS